MGLGCQGTIQGTRWPARGVFIIPAVGLGNPLQQCFLFSPLMNEFSVAVFLFLLHDCLWAMLGENNLSEFIGH